jgi:hypothetical protein
VAPKSHMMQVEHHSVPITVTSALASVVCGVRAININQHLAALRRRIGVVIIICRYLVYIGGARGVRRGVHACTRARG